MEKTICIITYGDPKKQPRVSKQYNLLRKVYNVVIIASSSFNTNDEFIKLQNTTTFRNIFRMLFFLKSKNYEKYYWDKYKIKLVEELSDRKFDMIIVHGIRNVPLALKLAQGSPILFDAHEYYPENFTDNLYWNFFIKDYYYYLCKTYINMATKVITVAAGIAAAYKKHFNVNAEVINSAAVYHSLQHKTTNPNHIKIIHHGDCSSSRKLEIMIEAAKQFKPEYHLYLMLVVSKGYNLYYRKLRRISKNLRNVHFLDPVDTNNIISFCNDFDISLITIPPSNLNLLYALPNKFFESIQSRLMLIIGPSVEMVSYVNKFNIGKVTKDFQPESLAHLINNLSIDEINYHKNQTNISASALSFENLNMNRLNEIINELLKQVN